MEKPESQQMKALVEQLNAVTGILSAYKKERSTYCSGPDAAFQGSSANFQRMQSANNQKNQKLGYQQFSKSNTYHSDNSKSRYKINRSGSKFPSSSSSFVKINNPSINKGHDSRSVDNVKYSVQNKSMQSSYFQNTKLSDYNNSISTSYSKNKKNATVQIAQQNIVVTKVPQSTSDNVSLTESSVLSTYASESNVLVPEATPFTPKEIVASQPTSDQAKSGTKISKLVGATSSNCRDVKLLSTEPSSLIVLTKCVKENNKEPDFKHTDTTHKESNVNDSLKDLKVETTHKESDVNDSVKELEIETAHKESNVNDSIKDLEVELHTNPLVSGELPVNENIHSLTLENPVAQNLIQNCAAPLSSAALGVHSQDPLREATITQGEADGHSKCSRTKYKFANDQKSVIDVFAKNVTQVAEELADMKTKLREATERGVNSSSKVAMLPLQSTRDEIPTKVHAVKHRQSQYTFINSGQSKRLNNAMLIKDSRHAVNMPGNVISQFCIVNNKDVPQNGNTGTKSKWYKTSKIMTQGDSDNCIQRVPKIASSVKDHASSNEYTQAKTLFLNKKISEMNFIQSSDYEGYDLTNISPQELASLDHSALLKLSAFVETSQPQVKSFVKKSQYKIVTKQKRSNRQSDGHELKSNHRVSWQRKSLPKNVKRAGEPKYSSLVKTGGIHRKLQESQLSSHYNSKSKVYRPELVNRYRRTNIRSVGNRYITRTSLDRGCQPSKVEENDENSPIIIIVRGVRFVLDPSGKSLKPLDYKQNAVESSTVFKRVYFGGKTYTGTQGILTESPSQVRNAASRVLHRSIRQMVAAQSKKGLNPKNMYCMFFNRFGKCNRGNKCPYIHDSSKVAVCTRFLRGQCKEDCCPFSHTVDREKMAICSFFLQGACTKADCPYRHETLEPGAVLCKSFVKGYCKYGTKCKMAHVLICPEYAKGCCPKADQCPYPHPPSKQKRNVEEETSPIDLKKLCIENEAKKEEDDSSCRYFISVKSGEEEGLSSFVPQNKKAMLQAKYISLPLADDDDCLL